MCIVGLSYLDHALWFVYALENELQCCCGSQHGVWRSAWYNLHWKMSFGQLIDKLYCLHDMCGGDFGGCVSMCGL